MLEHELAPGLALMMILIIYLLQIQIFEKDASVVFSFSIWEHVLGFNLDSYSSLIEIWRLTEHLLILMIPRYFRTHRI